VDLSKIDMERLKEEFSKKVKRKATVIEDIRKILEEKLAADARAQPATDEFREDVPRDYRCLQRRQGQSEHRGDFARLMNLSQSLDMEQRRAIELGLSEDQLALFDLLNREILERHERELLKQESRALLADLQHLIAPSTAGPRKEQTRPK
jgi:type I restriction enzyme R subunit